MWIFDVCDFDYNVESRLVYRDKESAMRMYLSFCLGYGVSSIAEIMEREDIEEVILPSVSLVDDFVYEKICPIVRKIVIIYHRAPFNGR